jgi:hypothetical protein
MDLTGVLPGSAVTGTANNMDLTGTLGGINPNPVLGSTIGSVVTPGGSGGQATGTVSLPTIPSTTTSNNNTTSNNTNNNTNTTGTTSSGTLSPAIIAGVLASIVNNQAQDQASFQTATNQNAASDQIAQNQQNTDLQNNTSTRAAAITNAEQAAAQGNQGLKAVLASLGALNGTGSLLAGRAVADSANGDIGTANNTYTTNNEAIQSAIQNYIQAQTARNNTLAASLATDQKNDATTGYQNIIDQAENFGDTATAAKYLPQLVGSTAPTASLSAAPVTYDGANVAAYAPTNSVNVSASPSQSSPAAASSAVTPVNSALYVTKTNSTPS